jgi:hypothetical protein
MRNVYSITVGKTRGNRELVVLTRYEDDINVGLREIDCDEGRLVELAQGSVE